MASWSGGGCDKEPNCVISVIPDEATMEAGPVDGQ